MARIRTIKPEFWDSPNVAKASPVARLTYIALWTWVDDSGVGTCNEKELEGYIFPNDHIPTLTGNASMTFREVFTEVAECFNMVFYRVNGRPFFFLPNFSKHQRAERKTCGRHPSPEQADDGQKTRDYAVFVGGSDKCAEQFTEDVGTVRGSSALGTGEQGNRGTDNKKHSSSLRSLSCKKDQAQPERAARGTRLPNDWVPSDELQAWTVNELAGTGIDPRRELERFRDYWLSRSGSGAVKRDWGRVWRNWVRKTRDDAHKGYRSQDEIVRAMFASATGERPGLETAPFGLIEDAEVVEP